MDIVRVFRHLLQPAWPVRRVFSVAVRQRIADAVRQSERGHRGELCVAIEDTLELRSLLRGQNPRARAEEVFAQLGVWDTAENSGVLLYVNWADRDIEIVADRGIAAQVAQTQWEDICRIIEQEFRAGRFEAGLIEGIRRITVLLARHFPAVNDNADELGNMPVLL